MKDKKLYEKILLLQECDCKFCKSIAKQIVEEVESRYKKIASGGIENNSGECTSTNEEEK